MVPLVRLTVLLLGIVPWLALGYENNYDQPLDYQCPLGSGLIKVQSVHSNHYEDRVWSFSCAEVGDGSWYYTGSGKSNLDSNLYDQPISLLCPADQYLDSVKSEHNNDKEDRIWGFGCGPAGVAKLTNCQTTAYLNNFDDELNYSVNDAQIITGLESYHSNTNEDRVWRVRYCDVHCDLQNGWARKGPIDRRCNRFSDADITYYPSTSVGALIAKTCPDGKFLTGLTSTYDNSARDRTYTFKCGAQNSGGIFSRQRWSTVSYVFNAYRTLHYCPSGTYLSGMRSSYAPEKSGRVWSFQCASMSNLPTPTDCYWTSFGTNDNISLDGDAVVGGVDIQDVSSGKVFSFYACRMGCPAGEERGADDDIANYSSARMSKFASKMDQKLTTACGLTSCDVRSAVASDIMPVSALTNTIRVAVHNSSTVDQIEQCMNNGGVRFMQCRLQHASYTPSVAAGVCDGAQFTAGAVLTTRCRRSQRIDQFTAAELDVFSQQMRDAIQEDCGLDVCAVALKDGSAITPLASNRFSVAVKDASVVAALQSCRLRFSRCAVTDVQAP
ncbi:hypothetical protein PTSG_10372 [Salpingoeca rosetta]|uniref:Uncharacterized protein n=1 Tax=Salpingoeca rosetta (strain ATCC 50818 / BSB-021) TaxID=946362 RepID=F2UR44_SALR5|nr:uncharacterized protein PTSG_10372 [Salpingoeca rosetta]EGD80099.1 hypothetical protein PTSG_10372 [Salpingoeca rosetta]|eukprot:XP_004988424.1 hypothetical protein PTSG_10372 [Salpingoeca rosetta]